MDPSDQDDEEFVPLTEEEMADFRDAVAQSYANGEMNQAESANMLLYEAWINGQIDD